MRDTTWMCRHDSASNQPFAMDAGNAMDADKKIRIKADQNIFRCVQIIILAELSFLAWGRIGVDH